MGAEVELDYDAIGRVLTGTLRPTVTRAAANVAANAARIIADEEVPVRVKPYTTDRAAAVVAIAHPTGALRQARDGVLTKAAAEEGLEVTSYE